MKVIQEFFCIKKCENALTNADKVFQPVVYNQSILIYIAEATSSGIYIVYRYT